MMSFDSFRLCHSKLASSTSFEVLFVVKLGLKVPKNLIKVIYAAFSLVKPNTNVVVFHLV